MPQAGSILNKPSSMLPHFLTRLRHKSTASDGHPKQSLLKVKKTMVFFTKNKKFI